MYDDVEFLFSEPALDATVNVRAASRAVDFKDSGRNRKRLEALRMSLDWEQVCIVPLKAIVLSTLICAIRLPRSSISTFHSILSIYHQNTTSYINNVFPVVPIWMNTQSYNLL